MIEALVTAGLRSIEAGSFCLAEGGTADGGTGELVRAPAAARRGAIPRFVPNVRGYELARGPPAS